MSLKKPYLDVRGLSEKEAYTLIYNCIRRNYLMISIPKYRIKQIRNAIAFANMSKDNKDKLHQEIEILKTKKITTGNRKNIVKKLTKKQKKEQEMWFKERRRIRSNKTELINPIPARIIYHGNGPKR